MCLCCFWKWWFRHFGSALFEVGVWTHVVYSTCQSGQSCLAKSEWLVDKAQVVWTCVREASSVELVCYVQVMLNIKWYCCRCSKGTNGGKVAYYIIRGSCGLWKFGNNCLSSSRSWKSGENQYSISNLTKVFKSLSIFTSPSSWKANDSVALRVTS